MANTRKQPGRDWQTVLSAALHQARLPMVVTVPYQSVNPIVFANQAFVDLTQYGMDEVLGRNCRFLQGAQRDSAKRAIITRALADQREIVVTLENFRKDGSTFYNQLFISPLYDETGRLAYYFGSQIDITHQVQLEKQLRVMNDVLESKVAERTKALEDSHAARERLLQELHQRVMKNLELMVCLIGVQIERSADKNVRSSLMDVQNRLEALGSFFGLLPAADSFPDFDLAPYLTKLAAALAQHYDPHRHIQMRLRVSPLPCTVDLALPLGLIVHELIANAYRHAFVDRPGGSLILELDQRSDTMARLIVEDNGLGLPQSLMNGAGATTAPGLGLALVQALLQQIDGTLHLPSGAGTRIEIDFPLPPGQAVPSRMASGA